MIEQAVINAGPLIALSRAAVLDIVRQIPIQFIAPPEVVNEINAGAEVGYSLEWPTWISIIPLAEPLSPVALAYLDRGEAAVIQLALERGIPLVCMDDRKGRRAALAVGLSTVGSLGLLGRAKRLGLIPAVRPILNKLVGEGAWYHPSLLARFLEELGE